MARCRLLLSLLCATVAAFAAVPAAAQNTARAAAPAAAASRAPIVPLDRVIAVVNEEAITQWDLAEQRRIVLQQMKAWFLL